MSDRTDIETLLAAAARRSRYPDPPDMSEAVLRRVERSAGAAGRRERGSRMPARPVLVGVAVVLAMVLAVGGAAGVHEAVARWLGIGAVGVELTPLPGDLPGRLDLGAEVRLDQASAGATVDFAVPGVPGPPDTVLLDDRGQVTLVYTADADLPEVGDSGVGAVVSFLAADGALSLRKQIDAGDTDLDVVDAGGVEGFWIEGGPHALLRIDESGVPIVGEGRLAGNTLLFRRGNATVRIELAGGLTDAAAVARSLPPLP